MNTVKIVGTDYVGQLEKTLAVEKNKVIGFDEQREPVLMDAGGGTQIFEDRHQTEEPPDDPTRPALSLDTNTGVIFQWRTVSQTWV